MNVGPVARRQALARYLGGACHIFVLRPEDACVRARSAVRAVAGGRRREDGTGPGDAIALESVAAARLPESLPRFR